MPFPYMTLSIAASMVPPLHLFPGVHSSKYCSDKSMLFDANPLMTAKLYVTAVVVKDQQSPHEP
jgi:hypothetical protein